MPLLAKASICTSPLISTLVTIGLSQLLSSWPLVLWRAILGKAKGGCAGVATKLQGTSAHHLYTPASKRASSSATIGSIPTINTGLGPVRARSWESLWQKVVIAVIGKDFKVDTIPSGQPLTRLPKCFPNHPKGHSKLIFSEPFCRRPHASFGTKIAMEGSTLCTSATCSQH